MIQNACEEYFLRISSILYAIENQGEYNNYLNDQSLNTLDAHNMQASLLRKGLAITNFCYFEDFIKKRVAECLSNIPRIFSDPERVSEDLQRRFTLKTLDGIINRIKKIDKNSPWEEVANFIHQETTHVSSIGQLSYSISNYAFGWDKENLNDSDIVTILKEFYINDIWRKIAGISARIGCVMLNPKDEFSKIAQIRHRAAHVAQYSITINDLGSLINNTFLLAFSIDYLLSLSIKLLNDQNINHLSKDYDFLNNIKFHRKIMYSDSSWKEYYSANSQQRCCRKGETQEGLFDISKAKLKNQEFLVVFSKEGNLQKWHFNF